MSAMFPDVPVAPGVPPVHRDESNADTAEQPRINADAPDLAYASSVPSWGVFDSNNERAIDPDSFVRFEIIGDYAVLDYPVEGGAFQSYNKVQKPYEIKLVVAQGGSVADRQTVLEDIETAVSSLELLTVITPELPYDSLNLKHYDMTRTDKAGVTLLQIALNFEEIRVTATAAFSNTLKPEGANTVSGGGVTAKPLTPQQQAAATGFG